VTREEPKHLLSEDIGFQDKARMGFRNSPNLGPFLEEEFRLIERELIRISLTVFGPTQVLYSLRSQELFIEFGCIFA
jgi:hypothetical protein